MLYNVENRQAQPEPPTNGGMISSCRISDSTRKGMEIALHGSEEALLELQKKVGVAQLAGGIAHHFNNLLAVVIGYGGLLQMKMSQDDPLRFYVDQMLSSSERAVQLTRKLLAFAGQQRIRPKLMDLNEALRRASRLFPLYLGDNVEATMNLCEKGLPVFIDSCRMEETLINLITNANDAMPSGGTLTLSTRHLTFGDEISDRNGSLKAACALVSLKDTGRGMEKKTRERIFEPFFTTKDTGRGIGLGLPIAYHIVKQHNGSIKVDSTPGIGTEVNIYLPLITTTLKELEPIPLLASPEV